MQKKYTKLKNCLITILWFFLPSGFYAQDMALDSLQSQLKKALPDSEKIETLANIARYYHNIKQYDKAAYQNQEIIKTYSSSYPQKTAAAQIRLSGNLLNLDMLDSSLHIAEQALKQSTKINFIKGMAYANTNISIYYDRKGDYKRATDYSIKSLKLFEQLKNMELVAGAYSEISRLYHEQGNEAKAIEYIEKAIQHCSDKNSPTAIGFYLNAANVYRPLKNYGKAEEYYKKVRTATLKAENWGQYGECLQGFANLELQKGNYPKALEYYNQVLSLWEKHGGRNYEFSVTYLNMSWLYTLMHQPKKAIEYGLKGYEKAKLINNANTMIQAYGNLDAAYVEAKNWQEAYKYSTLYNSLHDSIVNVESQKQINELNTIYETDKKQQQIEIQNLTLGQQKSELNKRQIIIYAALGGVVMLLLLSFFIYRSYKQKQYAHHKLAFKNKIIEEQHKDILNSIKYAQRIQQAILPPDKMWFDLLPNSFVLYKPKDVLSGDFYWIEQNDEYVYFAAADCTGHGVPGALMSIVNYSLLNKAFLEQSIKDPAKGLDLVNEWLTVTLHQTYQESAVRDGMDIALCALHKTSRQLKFAGAFNGGYIFKTDGTVIDFNGDKKPVGVFMEDKIQPFRTQEFLLEKGDRIFIFSDGYADQFGGLDGKKLKYKKLKEYLKESMVLDMSAQKQFMEQKFNEWKGTSEQVDDVLLIGVTV